LNNAVKFTDRGFVEVELTEHVKDGITKLTISVKDTGIGISPDAQKRIFRPFEQAESSTTRRYGGTGLGLAIVKQISEHMGGSITVQSQECIGTKFIVELELNPCEAGVLEASNTHKLDCQGLRALIVEDNRTNTIIMETFLRSKGFVCVCVENGQQAVEQVSKHEFDLVLMDNHMPVLDGVGAIAVIRSMDAPARSVLIFGCTADVFKETQERMLDVGANHIIAKPIVESELDDALYRHASILYQYQDKQSGEQPKPQNAEALLLNFYMALDDGNLEQAMTTLSHIFESAKPNVSDELNKVIQRIEDYLSKALTPEQVDIDQLTVLLAEH
ncbi:ATP-binding protein, partial [Vibrio parahaemolyticus]|nr:ATP-binding protein [Vibrio parahaemolyticus]